MELLLAVCLLQLYLYFTIYKYFVSFIVAANFTKTVQDNWFSPPGCWTQARQAIRSAFVFLFIYLDFNAFCQTSRLKIYQTDLAKF